MPPIELDIHPRDCPKWEYNDLPDCSSTLRVATRDLLIDLRTGVLDTDQLAKDTRPAHRRLFGKLVPDDYDYYAGHYRGEAFRCLRNYRVEIRGDLRVGSLPRNVDAEMKQLANLVDIALKGLDAGHEIPNAQVDAKNKLLYTVVVACRVFEYVLRIHPYANGNGHAARFLVWTILGRYRYWPVRWPVEPRPNDPPYTDLIVEYRNGNLVPLESYILNCIIG